MATSGATIIELLGQPKGEALNFTCDDNSAFEKGDLLWFESVKKVSGASIAAKPFAGIANADKVSGDGSTTIGVYTKGIFDIVTVAGVDPVVSGGTLVRISGVNLVAPAGLIDAEDMQYGRVVGKALATASSSEKIPVAVGIY